MVNIVTATREGLYLYNLKVTAPPDIAGIFKLRPVILKGVNVSFRSSKDSSPLR